MPEPELMEGEAQALAYARADFAAPHQRFVGLFAEHFPGVSLGGRVLDLGCGPADITVRMARAHPAASFEGVDGAEAMLRHGREAIAKADLNERVHLSRAFLPCELPCTPYAAVISNSLLHHLADPAVLWQTIAQAAAPQAPLFVMDLMRPRSAEEAQALVESYTAGEPEILRHDFHHSLLAAYRPEEVSRQLAAAGLALTVEVVSDRHLIVYGRMPS